MSSVDVIIPCYKYGHFLRECVESALGQAEVDVRILILDDASPDETPAVGKALASEDRRVEYRRHDQNRGHIATYNEGLEWASADYLLLLSADDKLISGALRRASRFMDVHPEVGLTYGRQIILYGNEPLSLAPTSPDEGRWEILSGPEFLEKVCRAATNIVPTPTAVVRTSLQKRVGGYRADLPHSGDMEMWLRFSLHSAVGVLDADQAYYRLHGRNMKNDYLGLRDMQQRKAALDIIFRGYGDRITDSERLASIARTSLGRFAFWAASRAFDHGEVTSCDELLDFALGIDPALTSQPEWARFRWKRRIGLFIWSVLSPVVDLLRGRRISTEGTP